MGEEEADAVLARRGFLLPSPALGSFPPLPPFLPSLYLLELSATIGASTKSHNRILEAHFIAANKHSAYV